METKGERASVREVAGGRLYWKRAVVQVAGSSNSSLCPCAQALPSLCLFPQEGRQAAGGERQGTQGHTGWGIGGEDSLSCPTASPRALAFLILSSFFHFLSSFLQSLPSSTINSGSELLQKSTSTRNHTCRIKLLGKPLFSPY